MVEIRIDLAEGSKLQPLMPELAAIVSRSSLWRDAGSTYVRVRSEWDPADADRLVRAVEAWLALDGEGSSAELSIGDETFRMSGSVARAREGHRNA